MITEDRPRMWVHSTDYREDRGQRSLINRGFWLNGVPRLIPLCRLLGHRPVVDGVDMRTANRPTRPSRWVVCDRCGIRTEPQGPIDTDLAIGDRYIDPLPGPWPVSPRGSIGGQLVIAGAHPGVSAQVKVGNMGSQHVLAAHLHLDRLGALYVHTEGHGRGVQRRLNPQGWHSRVIELRIDNGHLQWELWARRDEHSSSDPWWMHGSIQIDPRTILWGPKRYRYEDVGDPVERAVRMPHGDDHLVELQLQRQSLGRDRLRRRKNSWMVQWSSKHGIPTKSTDCGRVYGSGSNVSAEGARTGRWPEEAAAAIADRVTRDRTRYGYTADVPA